MPVTKTCKLDRKYQCEFLAPGKLGNCRKSMVTRECLHREQVGRVFSRGRVTREPDFRYGRTNPRDPYELARCLTWPKPMSLQCPDVLPRDFHRINVESVKEGIHPVPDWERFAKEKDYRLDTTSKVLGRLQKPVFPHDQSFGIPVRPSTPMHCILSNAYQNEWNDWAQKRYAKMKKAKRNVNDMFTKPLDTLSSTLKQVTNHDVKIPLDHVEALSARVHQIHCKPVEVRSLGPDGRLVLPPVPQISCIRLEKQNSRPNCWKRKAKARLDSRWTKDEAMKINFNDPMEKTKNPNQNEDSTPRNSLNNNMDRNEASEGNNVKPPKHKVTFSDHEAAEGPNENRHNCSKVIGFGQGERADQPLLSKDTTSGGNLTKKSFTASEVSRVFPSDSVALEHENPRLEMGGTPILKRRDEINDDEDDYSERSAASISPNRGKTELKKRD